MGFSKNDFDKVDLRIKNITEQTVEQIEVDSELPPTIEQLEDNNKTYSIMAAILFIDIRKSTHLTENSQAKSMVKIYRSFMRMAVDCVRKNGGVTSFLLGRYIIEQEQQGSERAKYGAKVLDSLSSYLTEEYGRGFSRSNVAGMSQFYMQDRIKEKGYPVITMKAYAAMENYKKVEDFLKNCQEEKAGFIVLYELQSDGGIGRDKFIFDGKDMYLISACATWNTNDTYGLSYISYARIKEWKYTDKGWFCYELCVPEPPEVTEIVDGSCLVRIKPLSKEQREMSERCVQGLGYQGNNLLCSNWDTDHMEKLDYNGMYEYLYAMKHQKAFDAEDYSNGIPKEEFESLIMEYLPVTAEQIQEYAVFDEKNQTYVWVRQGCLNYAPTFFGTSLPEVIDIKENEDGTVTLTVDAVCDMVICDDAVITHELTVKFADDGSFQYLGNEILDDGIMHIPDYQYRIKE